MTTARPTAGRTNVAPSRATWPAARRDGLARALEVLHAAAAESPVDPDAPSLWPALQARIAAEGRRPRPLADRPRKSSPRRVAARDRLIGSSAVPLAALAAAALLALAAALAWTDRVHERSAARVLAASAPSPAAVQAPAPTPMPDVASSRSRPASVAKADESTDLALLDDPPLLDPEGRAIMAPPATPPAVRFDLDRGVPMPPDSRIAQSAY